MLKHIVLTACLLLPAGVMADSPVAIAIHGGAGNLTPERLSEQRETAAREALEQAVRAGHRILTDGGSSLDAVTAAIRVLEDAPEFNAGRGSKLTNTGTVEMDASIMDGRTLDAGAVAAIKGVRHPIDAARKVMTDSPHVMLVGAGATEFAREHELEFKDEEWFITDFRREQLEADRGDEDSGGAQPSDDLHSTVGAVARDADGNLAAATSTGGTTNKRWGRVGDSPIIGAGTYADNRACAISGTGDGEHFIRHAAAYQICARMLYGQLSLETAADTVIHSVLMGAGADGGVIGIDAQGRIVMPFNTAGMYRAAIDTRGRLRVEIFRHEPSDED